MTTIHDFSDTAHNLGAPPPMEAFLARRRADRHARAEVLAAWRNNHRAMIDAIKAGHVQRAEALFKDGSLNVLEREALLRYHRAKMDADIRDYKAHNKAPFSTKPGIGNIPPLRWISNRIEDARDRDDYLHVLKSSYDDRGVVDPVLMAIPGSRRRRESGCSVYTGRNGRQLLRVSHDTSEIMLHTTDEAALEAAIVKAHHDFGPPLVFDSPDPVFIERAEAIAAKYRFTVARGEASPADRVAGPTTTAETAAHAADPARAAAQGGASTVEPPAPPSPAVDPNDEAFAELREAVSAEHGVRLFMSLAPEAKLRLSGPLLNFVPHPTASDYRVAAIGVGDGATLVAVRSLAVAGIELGETMILRGLGAEWETEVERTETESTDRSAALEADRPLQAAGGRGR